MLDAEGLAEVQGTPWDWKPKDNEAKLLRVRMLDEQERRSGEHRQMEIESRIYRMRSGREDFVKHGFTERCQGCMAIIAGRSAI